MNHKKIIIISTMVAITVFSLFFIGVFFSGLTLFSGVYNYDALSSISTLFSAIFGPLVSLIAAVLFYSSLISQKESTEIQKAEFAEFVKSNDFNIQNLNFSLVLTEIKDFNSNTTLNVKNHYSCTNGKKLCGIELINELRLHLSNPGKSLDRPQGIMSDEVYIDKEFSCCSLNEKILYKKNKCKVVIRSDEEIDELERIERRFWILYGTMYLLISKSNNKEIYKKIFASILPYEYLLYSLALFAKRGGFPDSQIIEEMLVFYELEMRKPC